MMSSPLAALRAATRDIHESLHLHPAFAPLMADPPDLPGTIELFVRLHGFHAPLEQSVFAAAVRLLPELDDLALRRKAHLLAADLAALAPGRTLGPPMAIDFELSRPMVLGSLYVIEGATLGGRELGRRLAPGLEPLGLAEPVGRQFLLAYGERQGAMWRRFCAVLEDAARHFTAQEQIAMTGAARTLFLRLQAWLSAG